MSKNTDYRSLETKLDEIIADMQSGDLSIDESIEKYEQAEKIIKELETYLKTAENKVTKIMKKSEN